MSCVHVLFVVTETRLFVVTEAQCESLFKSPPNAPWCGLGDAGGIEEI